VPALDEGMIAAAEIKATRANASSDINVFMMVNTFLNR
jgi:hypothetical protein